MTISILLVDDHAVFRDGLRAICEVKGHFNIVGEADNGHEAIELALALKPQVILMDIQMPGCDGLEATRQIMKLDPSMRIIVLTTAGNRRVISEAMQAGAWGYVVKGSGWDEVRQAVETVVLEDGMTFDVGLRRAAEPTPPVAEAEPDVPTPPIELTPGEQEVIYYAAMGYYNRRIAEELQIAERTVSNRLSEIYKKLGVNNRTQAVVYALQEGIVLLQEIPDPRHSAVSFQT